MRFEFTIRFNEIVLFLRSKLFRSQNLQYQRIRRNRSTSQLRFKSNDRALYARVFGIGWQWYCSFNYKCVQYTWKPQFDCTRLEWCCFRWLLYKCGAKFGYGIKRPHSLCFYKLIHSISWINWIRLDILFFKLGNVLATHLLSAFRKGLDIEQLHVIGHSLGAQLAGVMGRKIFSKSNQSQKLKRFEFCFTFPHTVKVLWKWKKWRS